MFVQHKNVTADMCGGVFKFYNTDTAERLESNKNVATSSEVLYTINSRGFRCDEFNDINWSEATVAVGCSITFGTGVTDDDTYPSVLQQYLGQPVINLGQPGSGVWEHVYTLKELKKLNPKRVIWQPTFAERLTVFVDPDQATCCRIGPWSRRSEDQKYFRSHNQYQWNTDVYHRFAIDYVNMLFADADFCIINAWYNGFGIIDDNTAAEYKSKIINWSQTDVARDLSHPGVESHATLAKQIANFFANK